MVSGLKFPAYFLALGFVCSLIALHVTEMPFLAYCGVFFTYGITTAYLIHVNASYKRKNAQKESEKKS
jgi:hypothetical protein